MDNKEQKINILLQSLKDRYEAMHIIRKRVQDICIWILGILFAASGWIYKSDWQLDKEEKIIYSLIIFICFLLIRFVYLSDLDKGFKKQQQVAVKIESVLGLFDTDFMDGVGQIFPEEWKKAGNNNCKGNYFKSSYYLLYLGFLLIILAIWSVGII